MAALGVFMSGPAQTYGVAVFIEPIVSELGISRSAISGAYSVASILAGASMLVSGRVVDRVGARLVVPVATLGFGLACAGMATVQGGLGLLLGFTALRVFGMATMPLALSTLAARWFLRRRGFAMSVTMLGMAASNAVFPPLLQALLGDLGWRGTWVAAAVAVCAVVILPAALLIREQPEAVGLLPDGDAAVGPADGGATAASAPPDWTLAQAARHRAFWLLIIAAVMPGTVMTGLVFHQVSLFEARGLSAALSASVLSVYAVAFAATTLAVGFVLERVAERHVMVAGLLVLPVSVLWLMAARSPAQAVVYGVLLGAAFGLGVTPGTSLWAAYYGRRHLGAIRGATMAALVLSAATAPLMLSVPYDLTGSYVPGLTLLVVLSLAGALAAALAGPPGARPPGLPRLDAPGGGG